MDPNWVFQRGTDVNMGVAVSPDGSLVALREFTEDGYDIWVKRVDTGPRTRLTLDEGHDRMPVWEPGGQNITFLSDRGGNNDVWSKRADGTGSPELLLDMEQTLATVHWSPDGEWLLVRTGGTGGVEGGRDIYGYRPDVDSVPVPLMAEGFDETSPEISPDGRWVAYMSNESDRYEVYVRPFPDVNAGRVQVSINGGRAPKWVRNSSELLFIDSDDNFVSVEYEADPSFTPSAPRTLFQRPAGVDPLDVGFPYDLTPDGGRFVMVRNSAVGGENEGAPAPVLVTNFFEELKTRVPN